MSTTTPAPAPSPAQTADHPAWHTLGADAVLQAEEVDGRDGLSSAEAATRIKRFGPNRFDTGTAESCWGAFFQYADPMQIVLLAAGIGSLYPLKEFETGMTGDG